jgi:hypothetical protein
MREKAPGKSIFGQWIKKNAKNVWNFATDSLAKFLLIPGLKSLR